MYRVQVEVASQSQAEIVADAIAKARENHFGDVILIIPLEDEDEEEE